MRRTAFSLTVGAMCAAGGLLIVQQQRPDWLAGAGDALGRMTANVPPLGPIAGWDAPAAAEGPHPQSTPGRTVASTSVDGRVGRSPAISPDIAPVPSPHPAAVSSDGQLAPAPRSVDRPLFPGRPRQIVPDGCCPGAWWEADSSGLDFIDRPPGSQSTAIYTAKLWPPGGSPTMLDIAVGLASGAARYRIRQSGTDSIVHDTTDGSEWSLPTDGNPVRLTPDGTRAVWWESWGGRADIDNLVRVYGADIHGTDPRELVALFGATVPACMPEGARCLVIGRPVKDQALFVLGLLDTVGGSMLELARGTFLSDATLSPDGRWVAFTLSLNHDHPERNGVFLAPTFVEELGRIKKLEFEGAYRWRTPNRLVYVPMHPDGSNHVVWEMDAVTGAARAIIGPEAQIRIANNDWSISPDGATMVWVDERGRGLWAVDLP